MRILLAIGFVIPFVILGYLISKLDKFLEKQTLEACVNIRSVAAIVLGETELAKQIAELLEKNRVYVIQLTEPFMIKREQNLRYLFALSESDADNIALCKIGKKIYDIDAIISVCNEQRNEGMFISEKIHYLLSKKATAQMLYHAVQQEAEMKL